MEKRFPIKVPAKNKGINNVSQLLFIIGIIGLAIFYLSMSPSENSSVELRAFWFIEGVPIWVKKAAFYGIIALIFGLILSLLNNKSKIGELIFYDRYTSVILEEKITNIDNEMIEEIGVVLELVLPIGTETEGLMIFLKTKERDIFKLRLQYYVMADDLMDTLSILESKNINIITTYNDSRWKN